MEAFSRWPFATAEKPSKRTSQPVSQPAKKVKTGVMEKNESQAKAQENFYFRRWGREGRKKTIATTPSAGSRFSFFFPFFIIRSDNCAWMSRRVVRTNYLCLTYWAPSLLVHIVTRSSSSPALHQKRVIKSVRTFPFFSLICSHSEKVKPMDFQCSAPDWLVLRNESVITTDFH